MGEAEREKIEQQVVGEACGIDCPLDYGQAIDGSPNDVDGWLVPVLEMRRVKDMRNGIIGNPQQFYHVDAGESLETIDPVELRYPYVSSEYLPRSHFLYLLALVLSMCTVFSCFDPEE